MHSSYVLQVRDNMLHDHNYLSTPRIGIVDFVDHMAEECPEMIDFLCDFWTAQQCRERLSVMQTEGQVLLLSVVKDDNHTFSYYTGLPNYEVFLAFYADLAPVAKDMQYVSNSGKVHNTKRFRCKPGRPRSLSLRKSFPAH